ncbi:MAG TPA: sulfate ABC transporter permease subunit CysT [Thermoanaerobaculia bacterium]|jgi:sulfate transport system permease protein
MTARILPRSPLPGFGLSLGITLAYLGALVIVPLGALLLRSASLPLAGWAGLLADTRLRTALGMSFGGALAAASINAVLGFVLAWVLVRYTFPGRALIDALVDLPFALPTAVSGIALTALYSESGWFGAHLASQGIRVAYTRLGVVVAMIFVGLPFVVRTLQPAIVDLTAELEEAAWSLGATRWITFRRVIFPAIFPALLTGVTMAFARAVGEYGSIVFIAGNLPFKTEIAPLLIVIKLEQYDYAGATGLAVLMLGASFLLLLTINMLQARTRKGVQ